MCITASGQDANDDLGRQTDMEFNQSKEAVFVNGVFVKSLIGFDVDRTEVTYIKKEECESPLTIRCELWANMFHHLSKDSWLCDVVGH